MDDKYILGVDFGGTRTKIGIVDLNMGRVIKSSVIDTNKETEEELLNNFYLEFINLINHIGIDKKLIAGIGISIGSYVFTDEGIVDTMCGFIGIPDQYPMKEKLEKQLGIPCRIENDAKLISYAESVFGSGKGFNRVLTLTLGTGVGVGFTIGGKPSNDDACIHLAGHIKVRNKEDIQSLSNNTCYCAVEGCLESTCSGTALELMVKDILGGSFNNKLLFDRAEQGDEIAIKIIKKYLDYLIIGLNQYVYVFAPDLFVLGGGISNRLKPWLEYIKMGVNATIHSRYSPKISIAELKEEGGIIGAACLFNE